MKEILLRLSNKQKIGIGICGFIIILIVFIIAYRYFYSEETFEVTNDTNVITEKTNENNEEETSSGFSLTSGKTKVVVHVVGEVNEPGVVELKDGSRIIDAINAAGGKTEDADLSKINLAYIVEDGTQIYVPRVGEDREEVITESAGEGIIVESSKIEQNETKEQKVNINTATLEKLQSLPGVGQVTAQKIIDYREQNGKFKSPEELKNVPGIGESKFNSLRDCIVVK